jgi:hypothetical protein
LRFWQEKASVILSRSRPYHKNDNRFVEENNFSLVRAYVGYGRLDTVEQTRWLNELYNKPWLYHNFFQPVLRLKEKRILPADDHHPARLRRVYDDARTPFDRLCHLQALSSDKQTELQALRQATNPLTLHQEIQTLGLTRDFYGGGRKSQGLGL